MSATPIEWTQHTWNAVRFLSLEPLLEDLGPLDLSGIQTHPPSSLLVSNGETETWMYPSSKKASGRLLDGRTWDEMPTGAQRV